MQKVICNKSQHRSGDGDTPALLALSAIPGYVGVEFQASGYISQHLSTSDLF